METLIPIMCVLIILFLICRSITLWYFKINEIIEQLTLVNKNLNTFMNGIEKYINKTSEEQKSKGAFNNSKKL